MCVAVHQQKFKHHKNMMSLKEFSPCDSGNDPLTLNKGPQVRTETEGCFSQWPAAWGIRSVNIFVSIYLLIHCSLPISLQQELTDNVSKWPKEDNMLPTFTEKHSKYGAGLNQICWQNPLLAVKVFKQKQNEVCFKRTYLCIMRVRKAQGKNKASTEIFADDFTW